MNYLEIEDKISKNKLLLLSGEEKFLMEEIVTTFIKRWLPEAFRDFNAVFLKGDRGEEDLVNALNTLPLMDQRKVVVLKDVEEFVSNQNFSKNFYKELENIREGTILLCLEAKKVLDKRTKFYKTIKKYGQIISCKALTRPELLHFLQKQDPQKRKIKPSAFQYFIDMMGYLQGDCTLLEVKLEWEKILMACQDRPIEVEDVEFFISYEKEKNIFALTDGFLGKSIEKTFEAVESLKDQGVDIYQILGLLNKQVENLYRAKILLDQGYDDQALRRRMGIHPFVAKKLCQQVGRFHMKELRGMLDDLIQLDQEVKTLSIDDQYLFESKLMEMMTKYQ